MIKWTRTQEFVNTDAFHRGPQVQTIRAEPLMFAPEIEL